MSVRAQGGIGALAICGLVVTAACHRSDPLPRLSNREFWQLVETTSEPPGAFPLSDNLVSNEAEYPETVLMLRTTGGVYIGVGPEQNFSYIAALEPAMAFIVDVRRENRNLHLLYKALFELSSDRADFVARLFSRPRPPELDASSSVDAIFATLDKIAPSSALFADTARLVRDRLLVGHDLPLSSVDLEQIDAALEAFLQDGPEIDFWRGREAPSDAPSYRRLMTARDRMGRHRSYLGTDDGFRVVQDLHARNLIVPIVGDFAGPTALRRIGDYVRAQSNVVTAFYGSNVGVYLTNAQTGTFCGNLALLPAAPRALFIDGKGISPLSSKLAACRAARPESLVFELPR